MNEQTLLIFAQRILNSSSEQKARVSLRQLKTLLQEQGASKGHIALLEDMILSMPEMKEAARKPMLTKADAEIAIRRANERKIREEAARSYGRC